jgi:TetR/AcrR family transcriptional regulator, cholesterol catabolism regulator
MPVREKILETALRMFRTYGIKSVTMSGIALESGVSKKTVYEHFKDKEELITEAIRFVLDMHQQNFTDFREQSPDAIMELIREMEYMEALGKEVNPVMLFEIEKYHPEVWAWIGEFKKDCVFYSIEENLQRGMKEGLYRKDLKKEIVARARQLQLEAVFDHTEYPARQYNMHEVMLQLTVHFVLGITTMKGRKLAATYLQIAEEEV